MTSSSKINSSQTRSIREWVEWGSQAFDEAGLFFGHGTDNAHDEVIYIIVYALKTNFEFSGYDIDQPLAEAENKAVSEFLNQRLTSKQPAAYLVNEAWFCGLPFYVDERVLVPRSPIAELIEDEFQPWIPRENIKTILEIGTGSGCIALSCAYYMKDVRVDAVDIDDGALHVANKNLEHLELQDRVSFIKSDVFENLADKTYDIIVSNPPYVSQEEYDGLPAEYHREPQIGLTSGDDGLDCVRDILAHADQHLNPGGILIVEVGNTHEALEQAFPEIPFMWLEFEHGGHGIFLLEKNQLSGISSDE